MNAGSLCLLAALAWGTGCVAYNEPCQPLVDGPTTSVATLETGTEIWLDRANARHASNAFGQAVADAYFDAFLSGQSGGVQFGVVNGGALRSEGLCGKTRTILKGAITRGDVYEVLLFQNRVYAVTLKTSEVFALFENSVAKLAKAGDPIVSPSGQFLQVSSQVAVEIDCNLAPGSRVTSLRIGLQGLQRTGEQKDFRVALPDFILGGGDGYDFMKPLGNDLSRNPAQATKGGGIDAEIARAYFESKFKTTPLTRDDNRIKLTGCATPARPTN